MTDLDARWRRATHAAQGGGHDTVSGAVAPPLILASTYERDEHYRLIGSFYGRDGNPTYLPVEHLLAVLDGGAAAMLFSSGTAAAMTLVQATLRRGEAIVLPRQMYWGLRVAIMRFAERWGCEVRWYDAGDHDALGTVCDGARLLWVETPANPCWELTSIAAAAAVARQTATLLVVDATVLTPVHIQPLALGADFVLHAASKGLAGHSDVIAGVLVARRQDETWQAIRTQRVEGGAVLGPHAAWLLHRGLRTLFVRQRHASATALELALRLQGHPAISDVLYPGLDRGPAEETARNELREGYGTMLSIRVRGGAEAALRVACRTQLFVRATSLGGCESLIEHRASVEDPASPVPKDLLRLSIGLEDTTDLLTDLEQALES